MSKKSVISITNMAWKKIISITQSQQAIGFLFFAESGGCNGFNYKLDLLNDNEYEKIINKHKFPPTILEKKSTKIIVDPSSEMILFGTQIDYVTEDYTKGLYENKFVFIPDKELVSSCGCGVSFNPK